MSRFFYAADDIGSIKDRYIFLDNNFVSLLFSNDDLFVGFLKFFPENYFIIDAFTRFEFLRDVYLPDEYDRKRKFIDNTEIFFPTVNHPDILRKVMNNALVISKMIAQKGRVGTKAPDLVDLLLSARLSMYEKSLIISGNRRDFPICLFDVEAVITYENDFGDMQSFPIMSFSRVKFDECVESLDRLNDRRSSTN